MSLPPDSGVPPPDGRAGAPLRRVLRLPATPSSAGEARRFARRLLRDADRERWVEAAALAVSELVTNAVLHAHSEIELTGTVTDDSVRFEVRDDNPVLPSARAYDDHATTGRGLELVAAVTDTHGVESLGAAGKIVWCCIGGDGADQDVDEQAPVAEWDDALLLTAPEPVAAPDPDAVPVDLLQMPATLWLAAREHHDALLRELALLRGSTSPEPAQDDTVDLAAVDGARAAVDTAVDADLERAARDGTLTVPLPQYHPGALPAVPDTMDLQLLVRPGAAAAFAALQDALDEGERLAAADRLLVRPGLPEIVAVRDWACEQVIAQIGGSPAAPWPGADDERFTCEVEPDAAPAGWDDSAVRESGGGAIAVDDANRIVAISRPLAALVGWRAGDLVGRRVVAIVPPRFREAHVAGFSRHLSTGDARALGVELLLPVLRADGTEVLCRFLIESTPTPSGRIVYLARITPVETLPDELPASTR